MFLSDHETQIDLLYFDAIAETVVKLVLDSPNDPLTIGIHGDWGAGKSSVLAMAEHQLKQSDGVVCLRFNGWQFQGFEDAKAALLETIITELRDLKKENAGISEKARALLKRVDYLKLAKLGASGAFMLATGIPHPELIRDAASLLGGLAEAAKGEITLEKLKQGVTEAAGILKPVEEEKMPEQIRAFHKEFDDLLEAAKIKKLVVLIDDLDRCLPTPAIETLEAIRLFLFAPRTAFIVAADEAMIEYAVKQHFPELPMSTGPLTYARNYLEKLIQVPFRIPNLGYGETQTYVALVLMQAQMGGNPAEFDKVLAAARECICKPWQGKVFDQQAIQHCFVDAVEGLSGTASQAITLSNQVSRILTDGTKGNPRQIKRFLNALLLRNQIAGARGLAAEIKQPALAKVMLAEQFGPPGFYDQLTSATYAATDGKSRDLASLEDAIRVQVPADEKTQETGADSEVPKNASDWQRNEWIKMWAKIDPSLKDTDLRPYMFVTRDKRSYFGGAVGSSHLDRIVDAMLGKELAVRSVETQLRKLSQTEAEQVFDAAHNKIMETENFGSRPYGLIALAKAHSALQAKLLNVIRQIPTAKLGPWASTGFDAVF
ncbi:MAG TPA: Qat anti-phage system ATPase QatA, partial [Chthoniobacterales bacterium]